MSPFIPFKASSRRSESPRETRELSYSSDMSYDSSVNNDRSSEIMNSRSNSNPTTTINMPHIPPSRPLTVAIPDSTHKSSSSYCPRRPNLAEILANTSPPPWTLSAFMAYLSSNHCLETLEFTMDAQRYRYHYDKTAKPAGGIFTKGSNESVYVRSLWERLMEAYIRPNGPREVNLPSDVRHGLISHDQDPVPPDPDVLKLAMEKVHELMEESVLVPFLNSFYPQTALPPSSNQSSTEDLSSSYDDRGLFRSRTSRKHNNIRRRRSPASGSPPLPNATPVSFSPPIVAPHNSQQHRVVPPPIPPHNPQHRASAPSAITQFARSLSQSTRSHGAVASTSPPKQVSSLTQSLRDAAATVGVASATTSPGGSPEEAHVPVLAEEAVESSPTCEPMTPPTTPPMGDVVPVGGAVGGSPVSAGGVGRPINPWKKMRYSFGWKRKSDHEDMNG